MKQLGTLMQNMTTLYLALLCYTDLRLYCKVNVTYCISHRS